MMVTASRVCFSMTVMSWSWGGPGLRERMPPAPMGRLALAFFASGFAALLCQIVWQRMLGIFAGSDTVSAALVVGAFLAGIGLGAMIGAQVADRLSPRGAVMAFAGCEGAVAILALASEPVLHGWLALQVAPRVETGAAIFALCFAALVLPTALMGASLPLLARAVADRLDGLAERIGTLYGVNTLGAGLGALAGGWVIAGSLGFSATLALAAALNVMAATIALSLRGRMAAIRPAATAGPPGGAAPFGRLPVWCVLVFVSGYVAVALEIVWVRAMGQVGQFHAYLFTTVLGTFLLADGLGMAVGARLVRQLPDPRPAFFAAQSAGFVVAVGLLLLLWQGLDHPVLAGLLAVDAHRTHGLALLLATALTMAVVAPPSFLIGLTYPLVQQAVQRDLASVGTRVGWVQVANIAGNAAGSLATGLVSFHLLGLAGTLKLLGALSVALPLAWLWWAGRHRGLAAGLAAATAVALALLPGSDALWRKLHAHSAERPLVWAEDRSGVAAFRDDGPRPARAITATGDAAVDRLFAADARGIDAPVRGPDGPIFIQGFTQGRIPFLPLHQFIGALGPLLHDAPRRVLVVGVGSGGTPWAAAASDSTETIRAIEIVGPVIDVLRELAKANPDGPIARMKADPRWRIEVGDGRRLLARSAGGYDVIVIDAVPPESSHSGLLYSAEFLELVSSRLAPGGLYVQWAPTRRVAETFATAFPHAVLVMPAAVMIGSDAPIRFDQAVLEARFAAAAPHLAAGNPRFTDYGAMFAGQSLRWEPRTPRIPPSPPLTDGFPRDEFYLNNRLTLPGSIVRPD
jgi:predicted membrane-bound spermidine synthase